jgi:transposase InsO family protein
MMLTSSPKYTAFAKATNRERIDLDTIPDNSLAPPKALSKLEAIYNESSIDMTLLVCCVSGDTHEKGSQEIFKSINRPTRVQLLWNWGWMLVRRHKATPIRCGSVRSPNLKPPVWTECDTSTWFLTHYRTWFA